jgi:ribosomal protein S18 acetylase RimI-like enzyme
MVDIAVREYEDGDRPWVAALLREHWGDTRCVSRGRVYEADRLPGYVATAEGERVGLLTYWIDGSACEITTLNSLRSGCGIGTALIEAVSKTARTDRCTRLWLITTNDNWPAMRFYLKRGFHFVAVHRGAMVESRLLKPGIPETGIDGIPITDEIEMAVDL